MKVIEIEDKVQFFSDESDEKDCAFLFVSNRFPGTSIAPLRCRVTLACFSLGNDVESTKRFSDSPSGYKKRMTRYTPLLQEKAQFCAVRDKQDPFSCSNRAGKLACISPEERA